jgi:hypothetical protein
VQCRHTIGVILLGASLIISGCAQPLVGVDGVPTATPGTEAAEGVSPPPMFEQQSPLPDPVDVAPTPQPEEGTPPEVVESPPPVVEQPAPPPVEPTVEPTVDPAFSGISLPPVEERWRYVQVDRQVFEPIQTWTTPGRQILWWYDPLHGRTVKLGEIQGDFLVQAVFRFRGQQVEALEVPYHINQSYNVAVPPAILEQIRNAGYEGDWIETFVYRTEDISSR